MAEGSAHGLAEAQHGPWLSAARARARVRIAVVGDVSVEAALESASAAAGRLSPGNTAPQPVRPAPPTEHTTNLIPAEHEGELARVVIAWQAAGAEAGAHEAGSNYASQTATSLQRSGLRVRWNEGGGDGSGSWAAVALELSDEEVEALPALVARSLRGAQPSAVSSAQRAGLDARAMAVRGATTQNLDASAPSAAVTSALRAATPLFIVGRGQQPDAFRRQSR